ncbi:MAG TPA: resolvase [Clostridiales bacterium]|nr:resolvase [Clostridiales bacterium]
MTYAYARVSTTDQNLERQLAAFREYGVADKQIFADKKSGKDFIRTAYIRMLKKLKPGDLLIIKSIDRLGRNYDMIIEEWSRITGKLQVDILVLDMPLLDTRTKNENLVGKFISDIVLQVLSFVAENERANIRARQAEGIAIAKKNGVRFGRPERGYPDAFLRLVCAYQRHEIPIREAMEKSQMNRSNFYYHMGRCMQTDRENYERVARLFSHDVC